jgi:hypothetical protein
MSDFPTLAHAMAALDALPIAGSMAITEGHPGVDFDALVRARQILPRVWGDAVPLERVNLTPQGGVAMLWRRSDGVVELTVDPFSLFACRVDTTSRTVDWTRAALDQAVADVRAALGLPPAPAPAAGPAGGGTPMSTSAVKPPGAT